MRATLALNGLKLSVGRRYCLFDLIFRKNKIIPKKFNMFRLRYVAVFWFTDSGEELPPNKSYDPLVTWFS